MDDTKETVPVIILLAAILSVEVDAPCVQLKSGYENRAVDSEGMSEEMSSSNTTAISCVNRVDSEGNFYKSLCSKSGALAPNGSAVLSMLIPIEFQSDNIRLILNQLNKTN
jgi:hypothetical protein